KVGSLRFYDQKDIDKIITFFSKQENFELFTSEQIEYIYERLLRYMKISIHSQATYCGSSVKDLIPLYNDSRDIVVQGIQDKGQTNLFPQLSFDWEKIDSLKVAGFQPFKVTSYGI